MMTYIKSIFMMLVATAGIAFGQTDEGGNPVVEAERVQFTKEAQEAITMGAKVPHIRFKVDPEYTKEAFKAKLQGLVGLYLTIDTQGNPTNIHIDRSLGMGLDEKAVEAVKQWVFQPATNKDGVPIEWKAHIDIAFHYYKRQTKYKNDTTLQVLSPGD
jgi:TonB family protein